MGCARREAIGLAERASANPEGAARARANFFSRRSSGKTAAVVVVSRGAAEYAESSWSLLLALTRDHEPWPCGESRNARLAAARPIPV